MRELQARIEKKEDNYLSKIQESMSKSSSIRRGMGYATVVLTGNLFKTHFLKTVLEILTSVSDVNFRIIEWEIGDTSMAMNSVTI